MKKYKDFKKIEEVRTRKKCPILSFKPIRESEVFKDMMGMGFVEALPEKPAGVETEGPSEQRHFKDRLGNIAFFHPDFQYNRQGFPQFNIKHESINDVNDPHYGTGYLTIKVFVGPSRTAKRNEVPKEIAKLPIKYGGCVTVEEYLSKMSFLIKYLMDRQGFPISDSELYGDESYKSIIERKMQSDPSVVKKLTSLPPRLKTSDLGRGSSTLKRFGAFDDED